MINNNNKPVDSDRDIFGIVSHDNWKPLSPILSSDENIIAISFVDEVTTTSAPSSLQNSPININ